jgi:rod shape-determining protein MreD
VNVLIYAVLGFVLLLVKTSLLLPWPMLSRAFDPLLILTIYLGLFRPGLVFAAIAVFYGYLLDIFSGSSFGFHIIITTVLYYTTSLLRDRFFLQSSFFHGVYVAGMVLLHDVMGTGIFALLSTEHQGGFLFNLLPVRMLVNGLLAVYLFRWVHRIDERLGPYSQRKPSSISLS